MKKPGGRENTTEKEGKRETRPGIKGAGPRGRGRGDQEQWISNPKIILTEGEKQEIKSIGVAIVTDKLFQNH